MIDWHCHILPGLDDGSATMAESIEMARMLTSAGFSSACCTPHHIKGVYDNTPERVREATKELQAALSDAGVTLALVPGIEYYLDEFFLDAISDPLSLPDKHILVEIPSRSEPQIITETLFQVVRAGFTPLIAHPERCELFAIPEKEPVGWLGSLFTNTKLKSHPETPPEVPLYASLRAFGCKFQGNLGSFAGLYGERVRRNAERLRGEGVYDHYGSDLHAVRHGYILDVLPSLTKEWRIPTAGNGETG